MTLQVLKCYRNILCSSALFSVATRHLESTATPCQCPGSDSLRQPCGKPGLWTHVLLLFLILEEEASSCVSFLHHFVLLAIVRHPSLSYVLNRPQTSKLCLFCQCFMWGKAETSPLSSPPKHWNARHILHFSPSLLWKNS